MQFNQISRDKNAASTELGYVFTFLVGVMLLTMFSIWTFGIETATRERWNIAAVDANLADIASAVERANDASRIHPELQYAEAVEWRLTEADDTAFTIHLYQDHLKIEHDEPELEREKRLSGSGYAEHSGSLLLDGSGTVWVVYADGNLTLSLYRPSF